MGGCIYSTRVDWRVLCLDSPPQKYTPIPNSYVEYFSVYFCSHLCLPYFTVRSYQFVKHWVELSNLRDLLDDAQGLSKILIEPVDQISCPRCDVCGSSELSSVPHCVICTTFLHPITLPVTYAFFFFVLSHLLCAPYTKPMFFIDTHCSCQCLKCNTVHFFSGVYHATSCGSEGWIFTLEKLDFLNSTSLCIVYVYIFYIMCAVILQ